MLRTPRVGPNHYGADRQERGEVKAERPVLKGLKGLGWDENELARRRKGGKEKVKPARRLRAETTMTLAWIGQGLQANRRLDACGQLILLARRSFDSYSARIISE